MSLMTSFSSIFYQFQQLVYVTVHLRLMILLPLMILRPMNLKLTVPLAISSCLVLVPSERLESSSELPTSFCNFMSFLLFPSEEMDSSSELPTSGSVSRKRSSKSVSSCLGGIFFSDKVEFREEFLLFVLVFAFPFDAGFATTGMILFLVFGGNIFFLFLFDLTLFHSAIV